VYELAASMKAQLPPWEPNLKVLDQVKRYFLGFYHNDREIRVRRKKLAPRLKMSVRTLDRYLHHLAETKWMETTKRRPRTAIRTVNPEAFGGSVGGSPGGSIGKSLGGSQKRENPLKENLEAKSRKQHHRRDDVARPPLALDASPEELGLLALAEVPRKPANVAFIRATVSAGVPIEQIRAGVCLARLRRLGSGIPVYSMKYFAGAIQEITREIDKISAPAEYLRYIENKLKRELRAQSDTVA
jgi:hypothetical protein